MSLSDIINNSPNRETRRRENALARRGKELAARKKVNPKNDKFKKAQRKYTNLKGPSLITNMVYTWMGDFLRSGPLSEAFSATSSNADDFSYEKMTERSKNALSSPSTFVKVVKAKKSPEGEKTKGSVLVKMAAPAHELSFNLFGSVFNTSNDEDEAALQMSKIIDEGKKNLEGIEKQFKKLFPTFKFPSKYKIEEGRFNNKKIIMDMEKSSSPKLKISHLEKIANSLSKEFKNNATPIVDGFPELNPQMNTYASDIEMQFHIRDNEIYPMSAHEVSKLQNELGDSDNIVQVLNFISNNRNLKIEFSIDVDIFIRYPMDYALWVTCEENPDNFDPVLFLDLHNMRVDKAINQRKASRNPPSRVSSMDNVVNTIEKLERERDFKPAPRTDEHHFCSTRTGSIIWAPPINNAKAFSKLNKSRYDEETGEVKKAVTVKDLPNKIVYTDWNYNKLTYTTNNGEIKYIDLSGAGPISPVTMFSILNSPIRINKLFMNVAMSTLNNIDTVTIKEKVLAEFKEFDQSNHLQYRLSKPADVLDAIMKAYPEATPFDIAEGNVAGPSSSSTFLNNARARYVSMAFDEAYSQLKANKLKMSMYYRIHAGQFGIYAMAVYAKKYDELREAYAESTKMNRLSEVDTEEFSLQIPNMPGLEYILPHQNDWFGKVTTNEPKNLFTSVAVGGGKTVGGIMEPISLINKGKIKRCLIIMPQGLLGQYANEILHFSQGKINPFVISSETINSMINNIDLNDDKLVNLVRKAPPNTIFLTSYDWLKKADSTDENKALIELPEDISSNMLINGNEMFYGPFSMGKKTGGRFPGLQIFPMVDVMLRCKFDFIGLDESHRAKETQSSAIAIATANLMAQAKYKRFLSGTIITDKPVDLVGPMSMVAPEVLGSKKGFKDKFMAKGQLIPGAGPRISELLRQHVASVTKTQQDWAFLMPDIVTDKISAKMTNKQTSFYDMLMQQAKAEFNENIALLMGGKPSDDEVEEFFKGIEGEGDSDSKFGGVEDEELQNRIEEIARRALHRVEVFLSAPDEDEERVRDEDEGVNETISFKNSVPTPEGDDLISPKARAVYNICQAHFFGKSFYGIEKDETEFNKVVVFSYNKPVSRHIMRHMPANLKKMAIRYVASKEAKDQGEELTEGKEALNRFLNDPNIKILVADETSMAEGYNLQIASRMIRVQTVWSPGRQEQVNGRVLRPDPKGKYNRDTINVNLVSAAHPIGTKITVDDAKIARMISKIISKARVDYRDNKDWQEQMEFHPDLRDLGLLTMNLDTIETLTQSDLDSYNNAYRTYTAWLAGQFEKKRDKLLEKLRKKYPEATKENIRKYAMHQVEHTEDIKGSEKWFTPVTFGQKIDDEYNLDLIPVVEADIDGNVDEESEGVPVEDDQPVMTAYGPGFIKKQYKSRSGKPGKTVHVVIPGLGKGGKAEKISVSRGAISVAGTPEGRKRFENLMAHLGKEGAPTISFEGQPIRRRKIKLDLDKETKKKVVIPTAKKTRKPETEETKKSFDNPPPKNPLPVEDDRDIYLSALSISGMPALWLQENDEDIRKKFVKKFPSWRLLPSYHAMHIKNFKGLRSAIELLVDNFDVSPKRIEYLMEAAQNLNSYGNGKLVFEGKRITTNEMRNFFLESHRKIRQSKNPRAKIKISPWLLIWDNDVYICLDKYSHTPNIERKIRIKIANKVPGVGKVVTLPYNEGEEKLMRFFSSKKEVASAIRAIDKEFNILDREELIEELREAKILRKKRTTKPKAVVKKVKKVKKPKKKTKKKTKSKKG